MSKNDTKKFDVVNLPSHYANRRIEVIDMIEDTLTSNEAFDNLDSFYYSQVQKYTARAGLKGNMLEDLMKARYYLNKWVAHQKFIEHKLGNEVD